MARLQMMQRKVGELNGLLSEDRHSADSGRERVRRIKLTTLVFNFSRVWLFKG